MTWIDPQNPAFQSGIAPFLIALLLVGAVYKTAGPGLGRRLAICGSAAALLAAYGLVFSPPPFPPKSASHKLGYLLAVSGLLSVLVASLPDRLRVWRILVPAAIVLGLAWIAESKIKQGQFPVLLATLAGAAFAFAALQRARAGAAEVGTTALVAAFALAGIAFLAPSASLTQMAMAVAAALGGFLLWTWPKARLDFAEAGFLAIFAPLAWIAGQLALYSKASPLALAIIPALALAPYLGQRLAFLSDRQPDVLRPIVVGFCAAAIAAIAVLIAYATRSTHSGYM